jgi:hypothetical protein
VILVIRDVDADVNNPGMDYMDEAGGLVDLAVDLRSVAVLSAAGGTLTANVTPLTEIAATIATGKSAAQAAAAGYAEATLTPSAVATTNKALAKVLGLGDNVDVTSAVVTAITDANGNVNAGMNDYGRVLAALSHAGDLASVISAMAAGIQVDASGNASFNSDAGLHQQLLMGVDAALKSLHLQIRSGPIGIGLHHPQGQLQLGVRSVGLGQFQIHAGFVLVAGQSTTGPQGLLQTQIAHLRVALVAGVVFGRIDPFHRDRRRREKLPLGCLHAFERGPLLGLVVAHTGVAGGGGFQQLRQALRPDRVAA